MNREWANIKNGVNREFIAAESLTLIESGLSARQAIKKVVEKLGIADWKTHSAVHALVFETLRARNVLDRIIKEALKNKPLKDLNPFMLNVLRVAAYQMHIQNVPPALATNEAVVSIGQNMEEKDKQLINALARKIEKIQPSTIIEKTPDHYDVLALEYFMPKWLAKHLVELWGETRAKSIMSHLGKPPKRTIRVNTLKISPNKFLEMDHGIQLEKTPLPDVFNVVKTKLPLPRVKGYKEGLFFIQDFASTIVSHVLNPEPEDDVLDACAAPGGKTTHIAQLMQNRGRIVAIDIRKRRALELHKKLKLFDVKNTSLIIADSKMLPFNTTFDKVLLDPPCTGSGTIGSRPETKWRLTKRHTKWISKLQIKLLNQVSKAVKSGGTLVYSTCSIIKNENEDIIEKFLQNHPDFYLEKTEPFLGEPAINMPEAQRLLPDKINCEGFFIAKIVKAFS
ncbi:MAG: 16S rRNA (cytosine(967)-C(5))-methyltransferase RsmB [Candidatus Hodarchaeota archaeon]